MVYVPTDWTDGITPVNAANLDKIEAGLTTADTVAAAAQPKSEKGQPNGYPSLDANGEVPVAQIGGGGVDYIGTWAGGDTYKQGDVVRYGPVDYLAVNPSTAQTPPAYGPIPAQYLPVPLVTTLPASPFDGQEAILTDSLTNPTYTWRFRYNAGSSSPYKWEFVGGPDIVNYIPTSETSTTTGTYFDLATAGPKVVVPRAGDYQAWMIASGAHSVTGTAIYIAAAIGAGGAVGGQRWIGAPSGSMVAALPVLATRYSGLAAGEEARMRYYNGRAGTVTFLDRTMWVRPVRVS